MESGLLAPEELISEEEIVPLDFTSLSSRDIGAIHSRFAVRHSHALYVVGLAAVEVAHLKRDLKLQQSAFRIKHRGEYKTKYTLDDAMAESKVVKRISDKLAEAEDVLEVGSAILQGYEDLRNAASREISRRLGEVASRD